MAARRRSMLASVGGFSLVAVVAGCPLPHNPPGPVVVTGIALTGPPPGPNTPGIIDLRVDFSASRTSVQTFTARISTTNRLRTPVPGTVQLHEEPQVGNPSGGTFAWATLSYPPGTATTPVTFHLFCPGNGVVGADQVQFGCAGAPACLCSGETPATCTAVNTPCSCFDTSSRPNDPNSNVGGADFTGGIIPARVHVEVTAQGTSGTAGMSNTLLIHCQPG